MLRSDDARGKIVAAESGIVRRASAGVLLACLSIPLSAAMARTRSAVAPGGKPGVTEVSPPNWWSGLPNPMLLIEGKNLDNAEVRSSAPGISVRRVKLSANGHWMFCWLDISSAPPGRFTLLLRTASGTVRIPYELDKRHAAAEGFKGFSAADAMYLLMPDRFADGDAANDRIAAMPVTYDPANPNAYHGGDLKGIADHLDYIQELGTTTLWITPIYAQDKFSAADYSGYRPVDLYQVNPHFGTLKDYESLAAGAHARGMKLVLDTVMNHVGPASPWVLDPPAPEWFHGTPEDHLRASEDVAAATDPHASVEARRRVTEGWLENREPDLNQSNPLVKQYLIQNAIWWIEMGALDGLRLDTFANVDREFWQELHSELRALYPRLTTVGDIVDADPAVVAYFAGGEKHAGIDTGLATPFDYPGYYVLRAALTSKAPMSGLTDVEREDWLYPHPERLVTFFGNQDTARFLSKPGATAARLRLAFGLLATMRGMPQIYSGDEIGMTAGEPVDNRRDFPGGFPGDTADAFTSAGRTPAEEAMHAWVASLLAFRAQHVVLATGEQQNLAIDDTGYAFARLPAGSAAGSTAESLIVLMNKSAGPRSFHLDFFGTPLDGVLSLTPAWNTKTPVTVTNDQCDVNVDGEQLIVLAAAQ